MPANLVVPLLRKFQPTHLIKVRVTYACFLDLLRRVHWKTKTNQNGQQKMDMNLIFFHRIPPHFPLLYCQSYYLIGPNVSVYIPADRAMCRLSSRNTYLCHGPSELQWLRGHISVRNILCVSEYTEGDYC